MKQIVQPKTPIHLKAAPDVFNLKISQHIPFIDSFIVYRFKRNGFFFNPRFYLSKQGRNCQNKRCPSSTFFFLSEVGRINIAINLRHLKGPTQPVYGNLLNVFDRNIQTKVFSRSSLVIRNILTPKTRFSLGKPSPQWNEMTATQPWQWPREIMTETGPDSPHTHTTTKKSLKTNKKKLLLLLNLTYVIVCLQLGLT